MFAKINVSESQNLSELCRKCTPDWERERAIREKTRREETRRDESKWRLSAEEQSDAMRSNECFKARREDAKVESLVAKRPLEAVRASAEARVAVAVVDRRLAATATREALIGGGLLSASHLLAQDAVQFVQEGLLTCRERTGREHETVSGGAQRSVSVRH